MLLTICDAFLVPAVEVDPALSILRAEQLLLQNQVSELYVCDASRRLLGVLPDYELLKQRLLSPASNAQTVSQLMSPVQLSLLPSSTLETAALILREHTHRSLPVVENGALLGVLLRTEVLRLLAERDSLPVSTRERPPTTQTTAAIDPSGTAPRISAVPAPQFLRVLGMLRPASPTRET